MKLLFFSLAVLLVCCTQPTRQSSPVTPTIANQTEEDDEYLWKQVLDTAEWRKSYNFQMFDRHDTLWTFHPQGNWFSVDTGMHWTKSALPNAINNLAFLDYVAFGDAVYGLGNFEGNIEKFTLKTDIYRTRDGRSWTTLARNTNLPRRFFYHPFVFDGKIWIIGGEDERKQYADIWNSTDGVVWTQQKDSLPFGPRSGSQVVNLNDTLYLLDNDVWRSTDGLEWEQVTKEIVPGEFIFGYNALVFDNKIWLLGCNRNGQFSSQVLVSADGKNWDGKNAPWTPRGGIAAAVHRGKIFMTGGKYGGTPNNPDFRYSNDLWTLEKKQ